MNASGDLSALRILLFDVDGVLTDNGLWIGENGDLLKRFDIRDGAGLKLARAAGYEIGLISGHDSAATVRRAGGLGIDCVFVGVKDKRPVWEQILAERGLQDHNALYMGDDFMDLPLLRRAGFAATVPEAPPELRSVARYTTAASGGHGAVREVIEHVLRARGVLEELLERLH